MLQTVISNLSVHDSKRAFTALFVLFSFAYASAFQGKLEKVSIVQCGVKSCATVAGASADVGLISTNVSLQNATLSVRQNAGKIELYSAGEIYFDNISQRIYLRGVAELKNAEAFYDLKSETLTVFSH